MVKRTHAAILALSAFYLIVETAYVLRFPLISDEFAYATALHDFLTKVPYRDFTPYKTVLGSYLQAAMLPLASSDWVGLMLVKLQAAVLTALMIYFGTRALVRLFDPRAVILSLALFVAQSTFLERSADLRLDMLAAIAGFAGLLLLFRERYALAGLCAAVSFFISQKGAYYIVASEAAFFVWALRPSSGLRPPSPRERGEGQPPVVASLRTGGEGPPVVAPRPAARGEGGAKRRVRGGALHAAVAFNTVAAAVAAVYFGAWSLLASTKSVFETVPAAVHVAVTTYEELPQNLHALYWPQILTRDPLFWIAAVAGLIVTAFRLRERRDAILLGYGAVILAAAVWHKQPWPYFFVIVIPTLFVAAIPAFEALVEYCNRPDKRDVRRAAIALYAIGIVVSLSRLPVALQRSNAAQRRTVQALERLLKPGDGYFAGINVLYTQRQAIPELSWFEKPWLDYLATAPMSANTAYMRELERARVKFMVYTLFIDKLPPPLRQYLRDHYAHLWGHIYVYAPTLHTGRFALLFDGRYQLRGQGTVAIDGRTYNAGEVIELKSGTHEAGPLSGTLRLKLIPEGSEALDPRYRQMPDRFIPVEFYRW